MRVDIDKAIYSYAYYFDHPADLPQKGSDVPVRHIAHRWAYTTALLTLMGVAGVGAIVVIGLRRLVGHQRRIW